MATTNSTLLTNLQSIYNTKLQIKAAIPTNSDIFSDYPGYITALKPSGYAYITSNGDYNIASYEMVNVDVEGGEIPAGYTYVSGTKYISVNGTFDVAAYENAYVHIAGAYFIYSNGTFDVADYSDAIVNVPPPAGYTYVSGTYNITESGEYDVTSYSTAYVDIESGGSGEAVDPWYGKVSINDMVENEETTALYYGSVISDNLYGYDINADGESMSDHPEDATWGTVIYWDEFTEFEQEGDDPPVEKIVRVQFKYQIGATLPDGTLIEDYCTEVSEAIDQYPDLYGNIYPILQDVTLTESSDPSNDGYDYLIQGDIYTFNLSDNSTPVSDLAENEFVPNNGALGFDVNVSGGDPWWSAINIENMVINEETEANYVITTISDNWSYDYNYNGVVESYNVSWDCIIEIEENENIVEKIVRVEIEGNPHGIIHRGTNINSALESYESAYENIYPILENATLTASEDPSEDGYDYLLVGDLYTWNLIDCSGEVQEITENGFYSNDGAIGFNVVVPQGAIVPIAGIGSLDDIADNPTVPMNVIVSAEASDWQDITDFEDDNLIQNSDFYNYIENMSDNSFICQLSDTDSNNNKYFILADSYGSGTPSWYIVEMTECGIVYDSRFNSYAYILNGAVTDLDTL